MAINNVDIFLFNTLTGKKELFKPITSDKVGIYNCGPTVYDYVHIGNLRTFVTEDILRRTLEINNYKVNQITNITDVDYKTIKKSIDEKISLKNLTEKYSEAFFHDLEKLNILKATHNPKATENISEMINIIEDLLKKGCAYVANDGIYFSISKSKDYGRLAKINLSNNTKERIANDNYDKEDPRDFALWKFQTEDDGEVYFDASFGKGRPGWHIECSAMSLKYIGETLDIHAGGSDLVFPHHTNEIAQSECYTGKTFCNYWIHGAFLNINQEKMAKSKGNFYRLSDLEKEGLSPISFRFWLLTAHYRTTINFTFEALSGAMKALNSIYEFISNSKNETDGDINLDYITRFKNFINDDLDTPKAVALMFELIKDDALKIKDKRATLFEFDKVLGLNLDKPDTFLIESEVPFGDLPENIKNLVTKRHLARASKDWKKSDEIRVEIEKCGYKVKDSATDSKILK